MGLSILEYPQNQVLFKVKATEEEVKCLCRTRLTGSWATFLGALARTPEWLVDLGYFLSLCDSICCTKGTYCYSCSYSIQTDTDSSFNFTGGLRFIKQFQKSVPVSTH